MIRLACLSECSLKPCNSERPAHRGSRSSGPDVLGVNELGRTNACMWQHRAMSHFAMSCSITRDLCSVDNGGAKPQPKPSRSPHLVGSPSARMRARLQNLSTAVLVSGVGGELHSYARPLGFVTVNWPSQFKPEQGNSEATGNQAYALVLLLVCVAPVAGIIKAERRVNRHA
jgi:hypothetical protein